MINLGKATKALQSRGPDFQDVFHNEFVGLGHRRLSIIDPSPRGNQPMQDGSGRYVLIYNGEIYNYKYLRKGLQDKGIQFKSSSDTEVLLHVLIQHGVEGINQLNGFFAFAFYDNQEERLLIARDRFGIKPLLYINDDDKLLFASELKSLFQFGIDKNIDLASLHVYLQLNYVPAPYTMLQNVRKLEPGKFLSVVKNGITEGRYYDLEKIETQIPAGYEEQKKEFSGLLEQSVVDRLVSDVPLGSFLSGGIDSSVVTALASRHVDELQTFSIGYRDEPFFDESAYANLVSRRLGTKHHIFKLSNSDLREHVFDILDYLDEPFADSSAIAVFILSKLTREQVTVALSGDGADELLGGYNKHMATYRIINAGFTERSIAGMGPLWHSLPHSRNNLLTNKFRQFARFADNFALSPAERYWNLAAFLDSERAGSLLLEGNRVKNDSDSRRTRHLRLFSNVEALGETLLTDLHLVLPNDMLHKVDLMSMANSLEIRVPFLDHGVVEFITSLPDDCKIRGGVQKRILKDAFRDILPRKVYHRRKQGFEVPLLKWFRKEMKSLIMDDLLAEDFLEEQGIFDSREIGILKKRLFSRDPGDVHATIWALVVFQWWYRKYIS